MKRQQRVATTAAATLNSERRRIAMLGEIGNLLSEWRRTYGAELGDSIYVVATGLATLTNVPTDLAERQRTRAYAREVLTGREQTLELSESKPVGRA